MSDHFSDQDLAILKRKSKFLIHEDMFEDIKEFTADEIKLLMYSIFEYVTGGVLPMIEDRMVRRTFNSFRKQHDENLREWLDGRTQKIKAGKASAEARKRKKEQR